MRTTATQTENKASKSSSRSTPSSGKEQAMPFFQAKLQVNQPGDAYEQEADQIADQVMRMPDPAATKLGEKSDNPGVQRQTLPPAPTPLIAPKIQQANSTPQLVQTKCADCAQKEKAEKEEERPDLGAGQVMRSSKMHDINGAGIVPIQRACKACAEANELQRKEKQPDIPGQQTITIQRSEEDQLLQRSESTGDAGGQTAPSVVSDVLNSGGGRPMDAGTRGFMESRFGQDFGQVRIHTGGKAAESAAAINARAYTSGSNVVFGNGEYQPESEGEKRLLAHELVHVGQQGGEENLQFEQNQGYSQYHNRDESDLRLNERRINNQAEKEASNNPNQGPSEKKSVLGTRQSEQTEVINNNAEEEGKPRSSDFPGLVETKPDQENLETTGSTSPNAALSNAIPEGVPAELPELSASSSEGLLQSLSTLSPVEFVHGFNQSGSIIIDIQQQEQNNLEANLPEIQQPTGLSVRTESSPEPLSLTSIESPVFEPAQDMGIDQTDGNVNFNQEGNDRLFAIPTPRTSTANDPNFSTNIRSATEDIPTHDPALVTSAGPRPFIDLNNAADPLQNEVFQQTGNESVDRQNQQANSLIDQDFGENNIYPVYDELEQMRPQLELTQSNPSIREQLEVPNLVPEVYAGMNQQAQASLNEQVSIQLEQHEEARLRMAEESTQQREQGLQQIDAESERTRIEQTTLQTNAREEVAEHRQQWHEENAAVQSEYETQSTEHRAQIDTDISTQITNTDIAVEERLSTAEEETERERIQTENMAITRREEALAQQEEPSFWDRVVSAISDFFSAVRDAINTMFDALRSLVARIIEAAREAVHALIDLARDAIVGLIREFGEFLQELVSIAFAAFPEIAGRINALIDDVVNTAVETINLLAEGLKAAVSLILDAIGAVLDTILAAYQATFNLIIDAIEFIAVGLIRIMEGIAHLVEAAYLMPDYFMGQMQEEVIGMNLTEPLPFERREAPTAETTAQRAVETGSLSAADAALFSQQTFSEDDIMVDQIAPLDLDTELLQSLNLSDNGMVEFGASHDEDHSLDAMLADTNMANEGIRPQTFRASDESLETPASSIDTPGPAPTETDVPTLCGQNNQEPENPCVQQAPEEPASTAEIPEHMKTCGPLSQSQRGSYMFGKMWEGITTWFSCNWPLLLAGLIGVLAVGVILNIVTGGAILAALPLILEIIGAIMIGVSMVRIGSYFGDYLVAAWDGNVMLGARNLARALAIGAVELVFALLFNLGAVIKALRQGLRSSVRTAANAARNTVQGAVRSARQLGTVAREGARATVRNGRMVIQGVRQGFARGARSLDDLGRRLANRLRFRRFRIRRRGIWIVLEGYINPWVVIMEGPMEGQLQHVDDVGGAGIGQAVRVNGNRALVVGTDAGQQIVQGFSGASRFVSSLQNNPVLRQTVLRLARNRRMGSRMIQALSRLESGNFPQVAQVLELLVSRRTPGLSRVVSDMLAGGNFPRGANFVFEFLSSHPNVLNNVSRLEHTIGSGVRRLDIVAGNLAYELKNWGDLSHVGDLVSQMRRDATLRGLRRMRYVISSRAGSREVIIQGIRNNIMNSPVSAMRQSLLNSLDDIVIIH